VRFSCAEKSRDPYAVDNRLRGCIDIKEIGKLVVDFIRDNIFLKLCSQTSVITGLDDTIYIPVY
jgi:hypothetical protein